MILILVIKSAARNFSPISIFSSGIFSAILCKDNGTSVFILAIHSENNEPACAPADRDYKSILDTSDIGCASVRGL